MLVGMWGVDWQWGTAGEWFGGIIAAAAVAYAVLSGRRERKRSQDNINEQLKRTDAALELDRQRWTADVEIRERWQARSITCHGAPPRDVVTEVEIDVFIENNSNVAISRLRAFVTVAGSLYWEEYWPGRHPRGVICGGHSMEDVGDAGVGIFFRDASGVDWVRWGDMRLDKYDDLRRQYGLGEVSDAELANGGGWDTIERVILHAR